MDMVEYFQLHGPTDTKAAKRSENQREYDPEIIFGELIFFS